VPTRSVVLHDLVNIVDVRDSPAVSFLAAGEGQIVTEQGEVRTGNSSTARLAFSDGSSVRLAPNTSVVLDQLGASDGVALTKLTFRVGELWVSLTSGQIQAQTPIGLVMVLGSYADIQFASGSDAAATSDGRLTIKCIEGRCTFNNGGSPFTMRNLQQLVITRDGQTIAGPVDLPASAVKDFLASSPESSAVVLTLTAAALSATATPSVTSTQQPSDTPTTTPTMTDTPSPTPTLTPTHRRPAFLPSATPTLADTSLPGDTPLPIVTGTANASPTQPAPGAAQTYVPSRTPPASETPANQPSPTTQTTP